MQNAVLLAIELGYFGLVSAQDIVWFIVGILMLAGLTTALIIWNERSRPDPFDIDR